MSAPVVALPSRMNAAALLVDAHVETGNGKKVAVVDAASGASFTYAQVREASNRVGNALRALGVRMEERVLLLLPDSPEFVFAFLGAIKIGAVPIPGNTLLTPRDYEHMLNDSRARVLVASGAMWDVVAPVLPGLRHLRDVVVVGGARPGAHAWSQFLEKGSADLEPEPMSRDDACFWLYSSGTTGPPKGAVHLQHDMFVASDLYARPILSITSRDRTFSVAKLFFAYGLGNGLYFPFRVGATTILWPGKPEPASVLEVIERHRPTLFFSVPTGYARLLEYAEAARPHDTRSMRLAVSAGESLPAAIFERFRQRFGVEILDGIGSTEIAHIFISNRAGRVRPGSTGEIVPGYDARLVDESGSDVPDGEIGDLLIKGDSTCSCYWNQHEKTKRTILGEWIRTGDKYVRDADGYYWYKGRSDDMLKVGGMWLSPIEVENALVGHPDVLECAVVGAPDAEGLVKAKAFVVLKAGHAGSERLAEELRAFVKEKLGATKGPRWIEFRSELPKTATGKTQRYKLR